MTIKFDNKNRAKRISTTLRIIVMIAIVAIGANYLWFETRDKTIEMLLWIFLIAIVVLYYIGGFCYVEVEGDQSKLDVKYYNLFPFWREYKRIMIPVDRIKYVKVRGGLGIVGAGLLICGRIKGRIAMFPTVGLSAVDKKQLIELRRYAAIVSKA
ncbi:hypothetical protein [Carboxylicivirga marina]|uniref:DUF304 domain-containing protein n=1 Tax=Carboxylicivirga marina TaxID=2800988 RepID=A0ABS1HJ08_9BACT|nr:hypothetical protein [Carboxylicivirga marina]MBK3517649.1 hypothetical protein [Carboxylicivirga marina]